MPPGTLAKKCASGCGCTTERCASRGKGCVSCPVTCPAKARGSIVSNRTGCMASAMWSSPLDCSRRSNWLTGYVHTLAVIMRHISLSPKRLPDSALEPKGGIMGRYVAGRFAGLVFALVLVSIITFLLMHAVPGGPFDELKQPLPPAAKANVLRKDGLDRPIWEQYALYMWRVLHLDFGIPFQSPTETVTELIARVWPATLQLAALTILLSYSLGILLGIVSALHQNSWIDYVVTTLATLGFDVPNFIIGIWLILVFSIALHWLPTGGWGEPRNIIMPLLAYSLAPMALVARYTRVNVLESLRQDYVRTARAKGLGQQAIVWRHVLKNALIPLITVLGPQIP